MNEIRTVSADEQVIGMVNRAHDHRRVVAENRMLLSEMDLRRKSRAEHQRRIDVVRVAVEAGGPAALGVVVCLAMLKGLIDPVLAIPGAMVCFGFALVRFDRFLRRG